MKKIVGVILIGTVMLSTTFAKARKFPEELNTEVKQIVSLADLTPARTQELCTGMFPDVAIECKAGTELPFNYKGNYGIFSANFSPNLTFKIEQNCYLRFVEGKIYMSFDLKKWEKLDEVLKGQVNPSFGVSQDRSHVVIETNLAKEPAAE